MDISKVKKVLIIDWTRLPDKAAIVVSDWHGFRNDIYLSYYTDAKIIGEEEYEDDDEFDKWFKKQKFNLTEIDLVLVDICW